MLLTKEVEVKWSKQNKKKYEAQGYVFTNYGDLFIVKISDLTSGNLSLVDVLCEYCKKVYTISWRDYVNLRKTKIDNDCCNDCKHKKSADAQKLKFIKKTKVHKILNVDYKPLKEIDISDKNKSGIYRILNLHNGKYYIGSAKDLNGRIIQHISKLNNNSHHSIHLQRAWNKYGGSVFMFEVLEYVNEEDLITREQYWMDTYNSYNDDYGYNICKVAYSCLGVKHGVQPQHVKDKISKANKGRNRFDVRGVNNKNAKLSDELVREIKLRVYNGEFVADILKDYQVDRTVIYDIINNKLWTHVLPDLDLSNYKKKIGRAKLTIEQVKEIRSGISEGSNLDELSKRFNVSTATIKDIASFKTWKQINI